MGVCASRSGAELDTPPPALIPPSSLTNADSTHVNGLLNSLHNNEVEMLTQIFTFHCRECADPSSRSYNSTLYNVMSLKTLFPELQNELFTDAYIENIFHAFDNSHKSYIDLRDFCRVYVIATRGSAAEMTELLYTMFADRIRTERKRPSSSSNTEVTRTGNKKSLNVRQTHPSGAPAADADKDSPLNGPGASAARRPASALANECCLRLAAESASRSQELQDLALSADGFDALLRLCFGKRQSKISRLKEAGPVTFPLSFLDFSDFASNYVEDAAVRCALALFDVLPGVQEVPCAVLRSHAY